MTDLEAKVATLEAQLRSAQEEVERLSGVLAEIQALPELEWAQVCSTITQGLALHARTDQPMAKAMLDALDRGKTYVTRLKVRARNEGLEKARLLAERHAAQAEADAEAASADPNPDAANWPNGRAYEARSLAEAIDAMKEPES